MKAFFEGLSSLHKGLRTVVIAVLFDLLLHQVEAADMNDYTRLRTDLKNGYDPNARPAQHHSMTTVVEFSLLLRGFEFDERRGVFTLYSWSILYWNDDHMKWDPTRYGNITLMHFAAHEVWQPDISVYNNYDSDIYHFQNTRVIGYSIGKLVWVPPTTFRVGCASKLRNWPYDTQICRIILGSWTHSGEDIDVRLPANFSKIDNWEWQENREWKLVSNYIQRRSHTYACCPNSTYLDIVITMQIQRHPSTHTAAVVVPALAIAAAILIAFWIRPGATERLALILFVILINSIYLYNVYLMIPNNGDEVPLVILYYRDSLVMVSVALVWTIALRYLAATKRTSPVPLPGIIQGFLDSWFSTVLCLDPRPSSPSRGQLEEESTGPGDEGKLMSNGNPYQADWAWLAHLFDRVAFTIYLIVYIIFTVALL